MRWSDTTRECPRMGENGVWMDLTFDEFVEILASFRTRDRSKDAGDKRRSRRIGYRAQVFITPCENGSCSPSNTPDPVILRDFSPRGVSLVSEFPMQKGHAFVLHLKRSNGEKVEMLCSTVHCRSCRPGGTDQFLIGAEFTCLVEPEAALCATVSQQMDLDRIRHSILD